MCLRGSSAVQAILSRHADKPARVFVVWEPILATDWMPPSGPVRIGLTAGASTPNNTIGQAVTRILAARGLTLKSLMKEVVLSDAFRFRH